MTTGKMIKFKIEEIKVELWRRYNTKLYYFVDEVLYSKLIDSKYEGFGYPTEINILRLLLSHNWRLR